MGLETGTYISDLVGTNPVSGDNLNAQDDHTRLIKLTIQATLPNLTGAMTATHTELNVLDGVTSTTAELNILDGVTSTAAELNILDGVTSTAAELNILDGVTATATEINSLAGIPATTTGTELGYCDGVTSAIQTQMDLKAPLSSPGLTDSPTAPTPATGDSTTLIATTAFVAATAFNTTDLPGQGSATLGDILQTDGVDTATWNAPSLVYDLTPQLGGDLDLNGSALDFPTTPNITDCLDEDTMSSDSATMLATQQSIKAYVDNKLMFDAGLFGGN